MVTLVGPDLCHHQVQGAIYILVDLLSQVLGGLLMPLSHLGALHLDLLVAQLVILLLLVVPLVPGRCIQDLQEVGDQELGQLVTLPLGSLVGPHPMVPGQVPQGGLETDQVLLLVNNILPVPHLGDPGDLRVNRDLSIDQR